MKVLLKVSLCAALCVMIVAVCGCEAGPSLALRTQAGVTRQVDTEQDMNMSMEMMGQSMSLSTTTDMGFKMVVDSVAEDGTASITATYTKNNVEMDMDMMGTSMGDAMKEFMPDTTVAVGKNLTFQLKPDGIVQNMQGQDEVVKAIAGSLSDDLPAEMVIAQKKQLEGQMGNEMLNATLSKSLVVAPEGGSVKVGDSWSEQMTIPGQFPIRASTTYTVADATSETITLNTSSQLEGSGSPAGMPMGGSMKLSGTGTSTITVDAQTGWVQRQDGTAEMSGQMSMPMGEMPVKISVKNTVTTRPL